MTAADTRLFDVPTPVERLLHLAGQYTRHNDMLDLLAAEPDPGAAPGDDALAGSAQQLAYDTRTAITAIRAERLYASTEMTEILARLGQLAYLSHASAGHDVRTARDLTALAADASVGCAAALAVEMRRRGAMATAPDDRLSAERRTALAEIARGHVTVSILFDRERAQSRRHNRVRLSTLRALEKHHLTGRDPGSAPATYIGGPPQDRFRLTPAGITALASVIALPPPPRRTSPGAALRPAPARPPPVRSH
ncbi:hypothetical protein [Streptomyces sp. CMB-StM0423]|uniref:hypothetical protein n=1 Tax=Streptomyces sp. CMB-StM0423 TaxID=2059884 RepID=UPI000C710FB0|nr:hypothetical protein [Streptomyces sp. CMB-StM0423]AUH40542.1 hypothetical protein CXR04_10040 [Streptomyces sp. CMB-StM0423]